MSGYEQAPLLQTVSHDVKHNSSIEVTTSSPTNYEKKKKLTDIDDQVDYFDQDEKSSFMKRHLFKFILIGSLVIVFTIFKILAQNWGSRITGPKVQSSTHSNIPKNIVFFLVDDLGHNDMGYNSFDIATASPAMTAAAQDGIILSNYYTDSECTPTRASLLTGMYSSSLGMQHDCITSSEPFGVPLSYNLLPGYLQLNNNYVTAMVGKWDIGHYFYKFWPTKRGFDNSFHLTCFGYSDYTKHIGSGGFFDLHDGFEKVKKNSDLRGIDYIVDEYSSFLFIQRSIAIIKEHSERLKGTFKLDDDDFDVILDSSKYNKAPQGKAQELKPGLFLYLAWNAVHTTLSVPDGYRETAEYGYITQNVDTRYNPARAILAGALKVIDTGFQLIVDQLKNEDLFDNTIIIVASDNGGNVFNGGNNYPLRGGKRTNFEGGIHVPAFIFSPLIPYQTRGSVYSGLFHVSDWLPTLAFGVQGLTAIKGFDGVDHWLQITEEKKTPARLHLTCDLDYVSISHIQSDTTEAAKNISGTSGCFVRQVYTNLIDTVDDDEENEENRHNDIEIYKFLWNQEFINWMYPSDLKENLYDEADVPDSRPRGGAYLFELTSDPYERTNLLWLLDNAETSESEKSILESILLNFVYQYCVQYTNNMRPVLWKEKQGLAKKEFESNDNFITYWLDYEITESDFANKDGSIMGPECITDEILNIIFSDL